MLALFLAIVTTTLGQIQGVERANGDAYLGIPYAQPPVDSLLFRAPVPVTAWDTLLDATYGKNNCVQEQSRFSATHLSRNCLYLNVYVPHHPPSETLPVLFWLHGGSYATGGTGAHTDSTLRQDMGVFAQRMHAIVVTVNYRLNVFGYLYLHGLSTRFDSNCGLQDQIMALQWVNQHIAAFGGNANKITLIGQSAGAGSVAAIMAVPSTDSLYQRVILMSPPLTSYFTMDQAREHALLYLKLMNIHPEQVEQMLYCSDEQIAKTNRQYLRRLVLRGNIDCVFAPVVDSILLFQHPAVGALRCQKPMLIGCVSHETELFGQHIPRSILPFMAKLMHMEVPEKDRVHPSFFTRFFGVLSRQMFFAPIDSFYQAYQGPKQKYYYDYTTPQMDSLNLNCCHSYEMPVIFGWQTPLCNPGDSITQAVGDSVCSSWQSFIHGKN